MARRTRQEKYPDTETFHYYNCNPKNKIASDCVVRAIATATGISWEDTLQALTDLSKKTGYMVNEKKCYGRYLESLGWVKLKRPRKPDGTVYTGNDFCYTLTHPTYSEELQLGVDFDINRIVAHMGTHHVVAIISGQIWDTWNSSSGTVGIIWVKPC